MEMQSPPSPRAGGPTGMGCEGSPRGVCADSIGIQRIGVQPTQYCTTACGPGHALCGAAAAAASQRTQQSAATHYLYTAAGPPAPQRTGLRLRGPVRQNRVRVPCALGEGYPCPPPPLVRRAGPETLVWGGGGSGRVREVPPPHQGPRRRAEPPRRCSRLTWEAGFSFPGGAQLTGPPKSYRN